MRGVVQIGDILNREHHVLFGHAVDGGLIMRRSKFIHRVIRIIKEVIGGFGLSRRSRGLRNIGLGWRIKIAPDGQQSFDTPVAAPRLLEAGRRKESLVPARTRDTHNCLSPARPIDSFDSVGHDLG